MKYNYHTHTYRCNHASGTEKEYVEKALSVGVEKFGFSDHIPCVCGDYYRVSKALERDYIDTVLSLREEYKDKIQIFLGYETEYIPGLFEDMVKGAKEQGIEYLILGQHAVYSGKDDVHWSTIPTDDESLLKEYVDNVISAMNSGYITYIAHPDVFLFVGDYEIYDREMRRLCKAARKTNTPLEINFLGIRDNREYPDEKFWKIAGEEGCSAVFGFDAHDVDGAGDVKSLARANEILKKYNIGFIEDLEIKRL